MSNAELFWTQLQSHWYLYLALIAAVMIAFYLCYRRETFWSGMLFCGALLAIAGIVYADFGTQQGRSNAVAALEAVGVLTALALLLMSVTVITWSRLKHKQPASATQ